MQLHTRAPIETMGSPNQPIFMTIACLRVQRQGVLRDWSTLRVSLLRSDIAEGLHALERICLGLIVIDQLVELVRLAAGDGRDRMLTIAEDLRSRTVDDVLPLLFAARHDLPGALEVIRSFVELPQEPDGPETD